MRDNFAACLAFTLKYEGGKVDDPRDPGGRTNQGITQKTFSAWLKGRGSPTRDVYTITSTERDAIYRSGYWDAVKADYIPAGADLAVWDYGVNSGPSQALKAYATRTSNDGATTARQVCASRLSMLHALGTFRVFGKGWTARVAACEALAVKMALSTTDTKTALPPTGVAVALNHTAAVAASKSDTHAARGTAAVIVGGAAAAITAANATTVNGVVVTVGVGVIAAAIAGVVSWFKAHVHDARATAYTAAAKA